MDDVAVFNAAAVTAFRLFSASNQPVQLRDFFQHTPLSKIPSTSSVI
jgi:hypothetical protein